MLNTIRKIAVMIVAGCVVAFAAACSSLPAPLDSRAGATATSIPSPTAVPSAPAPTVQPPSSQNRNPNGNPQQGLTGQGLPAGLRSLGLAGGIVTANNSGSLTLRMGKATSTVATAPATTVAIPGKSAAQISDVHVGDRVIAKVSEADPNAPASLVLVFPRDYTAANVVLGAPAQKAGGGIVLKTRNGQRTVTADKSTVLIDLNGTGARLGTATDIKRNSLLLVIGQPSGDAFTAQVVVIVDRSMLQGRAPGNAPVSPTSVP